MVLDLAQCLAHSGYSVNSCLTRNDTCNSYLLGTHYELSLVASAGLEWSSCRGRGSQWFQGVLPDLFGEVAQAACSMVPCALASGFITGICRP